MTEIEGGRPKVPATCLICGAKYVGGHALPGEEMREKPADECRTPRDEGDIPNRGYRVFYHCGATHSATYIGMGCWRLLVKNCLAGEGGDDAE